MGPRTASSAGFRTADPRFVGPADFRLRPGSAAIDAGARDPVYMRFRNFYGILCGIDIAMDHAGNRRRSGTP